VKCGVTEVEKSEKMKLRCGGGEKPVGRGEITKKLKLSSTAMWPARVIRKRTEGIVILTL